MHPYVQLAQTAAAAYLKTGRAMALPANSDSTLTQPSHGVFVTFFSNENLRGCIGTIEATRKTLGEEIIANAIAAATEDYRFTPITSEELSGLTIEVSVLSQPEPVKSLAELDPARYGVIVESGRRRGLLLPDLPGVTTAEQQVAIAADKGEIDLNAKSVAFYRFTTEKFT